MTSKFTREELLNIIETDHVQCGEASALARMALTAMDSEPVAEVLSNRPGNDTSTIDRALPVGTQLYRHAQPAPVVPTFDEWLEIRGNKPLGWVKDAMRESYDACRAAMLQAGNSPAIPDGYVMVPKEPTAEMIAAAMNCDDVLFNSDDSFCVQFGNIYEAMLAAAPQEGK